MRIKGLKATGFRGRGFDMEFNPDINLLIGPTVAIPAPPDIAEAVQSVSVTHNDEGRSGFQIVLRVGRAGPTDLLDYRLMLNPLLRPFNRRTSSWTV